MLNVQVQNDNLLVFVALFFAVPKAFAQIIHPVPPSHNSGLIRIWTFAVAALTTHATITTRSRDTWPIAALGAFRAARAMGPGGRWPDSFGKAQ